MPYQKQGQNLNGHTLMIFFTMSVKPPDEVTRHYAKVTHL